MKAGIQGIINELNKEKFKVEIDLSSEELKKFRNEVKQLIGSMKNIGSNGFVNSDSLIYFDKSLKAAKQSITNIKKSFKDLGGDYESQIKGLDDAYSKFQDTFKKFEQNFASGKVTSEEIAELTRLKSALNDVISASREKVSLDKASASSSASEIMTMEKRASCLTRIANLIAQCEANQKNWSAASRGSTKEEYSKYESYISELKQLAKGLEDGTISLENFNSKFKSLQKNVAQTNTAIKSAGKNVKSFVDRFGTIASKLSAWFTAQKVLELAQRLLRQMITNVRALDSAMTELKKVTDATDKQYTEFLEGAVARAKKLGATLVDTVSSSADMARLGFNLTDAATLADVALLYKNVGDGISDIDEASSSIISTMQAFKVEARDAISIVDKFNITGNNFAISSGGIGTALLNSASALAAANNNLDQSIALITAANTVVQDPAKVGVYSPNNTVMY